LLLDLIGKPDVVGGSHRHIFASCAGKGFVYSSTDTHVSVILQKSAFDSVPLNPRVDKLCGVVFGTVIDDNELNVLVGLPENTIKAFIQETRVVVTACYDSYQRAGIPS
jgi:hypothetical protein